MYIYQNKWSPISWVQGSKPGSPQIVPGAKNGFLHVPVSELLFQRLEDSPEDVLGTFYKLLGAFWSSSGLVKTLIPYSTSSKNHAINGPTSKTPLRSALEAFWNGWRRPWSGFSDPFWSPLAALTGDPVNKIRFFVASEGFDAFSCFQMVSGDAFGWYLQAFLVVRSCILSVL